MNGKPPRYLRSAMAYRRAKHRVHTQRSFDLADTLPELEDALTPLLAPSTPVWRARDQNRQPDAVASSSGLTIPDAFPRDCVLML